MGPRKINTTLQCPKCGQYITFTVPEGQEATAVCDYCRIPMRKMPEIVKTEHEDELDTRVSTLEMEVSALKEDVSKLEKLLVLSGGTALMAFDRTDILLDELKRIWRSKKSRWHFRNDEPYAEWPDRLTHPLKKLREWVESK